MPGPVAARVTGRVTAVVISVVAAVVRVALVAVIVAVVGATVTRQLNDEHWWTLTRCSNDELGKDDVMHVGYVVDEAIRVDETEKVVSAGGSTESNVQLTMAEDIITPEIEAGLFQRLSLRLIDGHSIT